MDKIRKLENPEHDEFLIKTTIYKIGKSKNPLSNIEYKGNTYQLSSNVQKTFNVHLTKKLYNDGDIKFISSTENEILLDIYKYKNNK